MYIDPKEYLFSSAGLCHQRKPAASRRVPTDWDVVSSDTHLIIGGSDIFYERAPSHVKDRMPRVWQDEKSGLWHFGVNFKPFYPEAAQPIQASEEGRPGAWDVDARVIDMEGEGVAKELAFPQILALWFLHPDIEAREWVFRIYNEYLSELQAKQPGKFYGVAIGNYWNPGAALEWAQEIKRLGLKTYMLPNVPAKGERGKIVRYAEDHMQPIWEAAEDVGLPVCFHIAENVEYDGPGAVASFAMFNTGSSSFRRIFAELVFGGVFDRHPSLRIVFAEAGLNWVPGALQDAEVIVDTLGKGGVLDVAIKKRPTEYWRENCYATFMWDPAGLELISSIGVDRTLWSSDYPHNESTFGTGAAAIDSIIDAVGMEDAKKILGTNAIQLFDLR